MISAQHAKCQSDDVEQAGFNVGSNCDSLKGTFPMALNGADTMYCLPFLLKETVASLV